MQVTLLISIGKYQYTTFGGSCMIDFIDYLASIPVPCLIGLCGAFAIIFLPLVQWLEYRHDVKEHGKEVADEIWRRWC